MSAAETKTINSDFLKTLTYPFPADDAHPPRNGNLQLQVTDNARLGRQLLMARAALRMGCARVTIVLPDTLMAEVAVACPEATLLSSADLASGVTAAIEHENGTRIVARDSAGEQIGIAGEIAEVTTGRVTLVLRPTTTVVGADGALFVNEDDRRNIVEAAGCAVLTGCAAGLVAQGLPAQDAALWALYVHGLASEAVAKDYCAITALGRDIVERLPGALRYAMKTLEPTKETGRPGLRRVAS